MEPTQRQKISGFFKKHKPSRAFFLSGIAAAGWAAGYVSPDIAQSVLSSGFAEALANAPLADTLAAANDYYRGASSYTAGLARGALDGFTAFGASAYLDLRAGLEGIAHDAAAISQALRNELRDRAMIIAETAAVARSTAGDAISALGAMLPKSPAEVIPWCVTAGTAVLALHERIVKLRDATLDSVKLFRFFRRRGPGQDELTPEATQQAKSAGVSSQVMGNMTINIAIGGEAASTTAILTLAKALQENDRSIVSNPEKLMQRLEQAVAIDDVAKRQQQAEAESAELAKRDQHKAEMELQQEATRRRAIELFSRLNPSSMNSDISANSGKLVGVDEFDEFAATFNSALKAKSAVNAIMHGDVLATNVRPKYRLSEGTAMSAESDTDGIIMNKLGKGAKTVAQSPIIAIDAKNEISDTYLDIGSP